MNRHKIKSYKYRIDFKSGNKAEIHQNYFMGSDMLIRSLSRFLWQLIKVKQPKLQICVTFSTKLDVSCFSLLFSKSLAFPYFLSYLHVSYMKQIPFSIPTIFNRAHVDILKNALSYICYLSGNHKKNKLTAKDNNFILAELLFN